MAKSIKALKQNTAPPKHQVDLHLKDRAQWEAELFDDVQYFTVAYGLGAGVITSTRFDDYSLAAMAAYTDPKAMLYAVASDDQSFLIPKSEFGAYLIKWKAKKGIT